MSTAPAAPAADPRELAHQINERLPQPSIYIPTGRARHPTEAAPSSGADASRAPWRISPEPFWLTPTLVQELEQLGGDILQFYKVANSLYLESVRGREPPWVSEYLDQGRPESVVEYGRMNRFRRHLPHVIRPDILLTDAGLVVTELDSVPGGIGFTGSLAEAYAALGFELAGAGAGMVDAFAAMLRAVGDSRDPTVAIVVSDEAADYRPELTWLAERLTVGGLACCAIHPRDVTFTEERLLVGRGPTEYNGAPIDVLYRFFELFDLKNVPKWELMFYAAKKQWVAMTPPPKSYLEEKSLFGLLHHPTLESYWRGALGEPVWARLRRVFPRTWILDPRPLPPHGAVPDLRLAGRAVQSWSQLKRLTQRERQLVIKPSGFTELAWGSRGVSVGHDMASDEWAAAVDHALAAFPVVRYVLQPFWHSRRVHVTYYDFDADEVRPMDGRVRLCPYYYVMGDEAKLAGVLATICPPDKKLIHGMVDAVMAPCGISADGESA